MRHLAVPSIEDRVVERSVLDVLDTEIDPLLLPWSFAYRRGLGVDDAIQELVVARDRGYQWVLHTSNRPVIVPTQSLMALPLVGHWGGPCTGTIGTPRPGSSGPIEGGAGSSSAHVR